MKVQSVLITGAASGIGRALALHYAAPGRVLHLADRNEGALADVADRCRTLGSEVYTLVCDVREAVAMRNWVTGCKSLDLVIGCAGTQFTSLVGHAETEEQTRTTFDVNIGGSLNLAFPAMELMARQPAGEHGVKGQIALIASLGAFVSVPGASAYTASKAAVDNWVVGRSALARRQGIYLTSICPGYVRTPLSELNAYPMHGLMEPEYAARVIARRLEKRPVRLAFPWRMMAAAKFGGMLPAGFPARTLARNFDRKAARA